MSNDDTNTESESTDSDATKDVSTGGDTATVDLQDLLDDYREEAARLRELKEKAEGSDDANSEEAAADEDEEEDEEAVEWPPDEWVGVERPVKAAEHAADLVSSDIERFGGSEFVIKKARAGEAARATDLVAEDAIKTDADPRSQVQMQEHHKVQVCVEKVPTEAPTTPDGRLNTLDMEQPTFEWLNNRVETFNTYGEVELSDF